MTQTLKPLDETDALTDSIAGHKNSEPRTRNLECETFNLELPQTLPARWYTDPAVFALERQRIFMRSWQHVGLTEDLACAGDFFTARAGQVPIVAVRDGEGARAFVNVCRHRGSQLIHEERGNRKSLQCAYHAWTYNLDGSLRA